MAYRLSQFSRSYLDQKMADILEYYENKNTRFIGKNRHIISIERNGCHLWDKYRKGSGYKTVMLSEEANNLRVCVRVHQLIYYLFTGHTHKADHELSHLCHQKTCVNFNHLNLEPHHINLQRRECFRKKVCKGHDSHPDCIIIVS